MTRRKSESGYAALVVLGVILVASLVVGFLAYSYAVSIRNQALDRETRLRALYSSNQNELSTYISTFYEQTGLAQAKSERLNELIRGAIEGRYGDSGFKGGTFAAAIVEAYPDIKGLDIYDKILPTVAAGREGFRNKQNILIDSAREYDNWRKQGIFRAWVLSGVYPSRDLKIQVGSNTYYAQEALDKLANPVVTSSTVDAFQSGTMEPLKLPPVLPKPKQ